MKRLFDAYRIHPRLDGIHYELCGRMVIAGGRLSILFDQYSHLHPFQEGQVTQQTEETLRRFNNGYYQLGEVERFVSPEKLDAYRKTSYEAGVRIRIGEPAALMGVAWAFVTAWNPGSHTPLPDDINAARAQRLEADVRHRWDFRRGRGVPDELGRTPEDSLLVLGISQQEALGL